jgi:hypothetical protein
MKHLSVLLSGCAVFICCSGSGNGFAVRDIDCITRIELSDRNTHIVLSQTGNDEWLVSSFKANRQNVLNLKKILADIEVRYPLPKMYDSVYSRKTIINEGILIKAYKGKKIVKCYYLLFTDEENAKVIALKDEKQKAYVMELPGMDIDLSAYIVLESAFWENNILFSCSRGQIKYLKIENREDLGNSFSIKIADSISLFDTDGKNIPFNSLKMERYLSYFSNISFDCNLNVEDEEKQKIISLNPLYVMTVKSDRDSMTCFINPISNSDVDDYGVPLVYNRDFFYLTVPQKNLFAKAGWLKFDILLEDLSYLRDGINSL